MRIELFICINMFHYGFCLWFRQNKFSLFKYIIHIYILLHFFKNFYFFSFTCISLFYLEIIFGISDKLKIHYYFLIVPMPFANIAFNVYLYHILHKICWDRLLNIMLVSLIFLRYSFASNILLLLLLLSWWWLWFYVILFGLGDFSSIKPFKIFFAIFLYLEFR